MHASQRSMNNFERVYCVRLRCPSVPCRLTTARCIASAPPTPVLSCRCLRTEGPVAPVGLAPLMMLALQRDVQTLRDFRARQPVTWKFSSACLVTCVTEHQLGGMYQESLSVPAAVSFGVRVSLCIAQCCHSVTVFAVVAVVTLQLDLLPACDTSFCCSVLRLLRMTLHLTSVCKARICSFSRCSWDCHRAVSRFITHEHAVSG